MIIRKLRLETMRVSSQTGALAKLIIPLEIGDFMTLFSSRFRDDSTPILHVFNEDFSDKKMSFGELGNHGDANEPFWLISNGGRPGSFWMASDHSLVYAPYLYEGKLFRYEREGDTWKLAKVLEGVTNIEKAFKRMGHDLLRPGGVPTGMKAAIHISAISGRFSAIIYNESQRVFVLNDGRIVHFSSLYVDDGYRLFVEVFDADGKLVGYGPISRLEGAEEVDLHRRCRVVWKDDQDQFYLLERSDNPGIHVVSLSY